MTYGITNDQHYSDIADAIRAKRTDLPAGTTFTPSVMASAIKRISAGTLSKPYKAVNFVDYDGTILYSYTAAEYQALTENPAAPSHDGLTFHSWNWTLSDGKAQLTAQPEDGLTIGAIYDLNASESRIYIVLTDSTRLSPRLSFAVNGSVTVNWGDGTSDTVTGTSLTTQKHKTHTYTDIGNYVITITKADATSKYAFFGTSTYSLLNAASASITANRVYGNAVMAVEVGLDAGIGNYGLASLFNLRHVTLHSSITEIGQHAFDADYSLKFVAIPAEVTTIGQYAFSACYALEKISLPKGLTSLPNYIFSNCYGLRNVAIPSEATSLGNGVFNSCYGLAGITIPAGVTSIGNSAFATCTGMKEYRVKPTTPPTMGTTVFNNIQSGCQIKVPSANVTTYKNADGWSTYASYIVGGA